MPEPRMNVVEHQGQRFYLFPDHLDWFVQDADAPLFTGFEPESIKVHYGFADHEFDHLLLGVTNRCNIVCDYCFRGYDMHKAARELEFEDFTEVADHFLARAKRNPTIQFTGGEVFVKEGIEHWFDYIHQRGFRIWMTTNGVSHKIRENRLINKIFSSNKRVHVRVSCDGHNAELYERHRGKPGTFLRVEDNLRHLVAHDVPVSVKTVVTPDNFPYLEDILEWCHDLGLAGWNFNVLRYTGAMAEIPPENATAKSAGHIDYIGYKRIGRALTDIVERKPYLGRLLGISRYGKIIDTLYSSVTHGVRMQYYMLNYDGNVYTNDNLMTEEHSCGNIWRDGMAAFRKLETRQQTLDLDLPCCTRCPIHRFCFQKGDFGELYERDPMLQSEFPNCPDIRSHFFDMMALGQRGLNLETSIFGSEAETDV